MTRVARLAAASPLLLLLIARPSRGSTYLDWADKFVQAYVTCVSDNYDNMECTIDDLWDDYWAWSPPTWEYLGAQGASSTGRANAVEQIMFQFRDSNSGSYTATTTLARYRTTSPPSEGSSCTGGTFVDSVSRTVSSTGFSGADWYLNNRELPTMDFSAETATSGTTVGYRSVVSFSADNGGTPITGNSSGCYDIYWE